MKTEVIELLMVSALSWCESLRENTVVFTGRTDLTQVGWQAAEDVR